MNRDDHGAYRAELRARLGEQQGDRGAAIEHYREALRIDPGRADYMLRIANLYAFQRRWNEAVRWLERYLESDPYPPAAYHELLGDYLLAAGREQRAVAAYERAIELDPYTQQARLRLADYHARQGEADEAIEMLEFLTVYAVDRSPEIYDRLAALYIEREDSSAARRILDKGARIFPTSVAIYNRRQQLETMSR